MPFVFRGTPLLVQIFLIYYGLSQFPEIRQSFLWVFLRQPYWCAILALTLNTSAMRARSSGADCNRCRSARSRRRAPAACPGFLLFRRIIFPIALRQALPAYGNEIILMVKATSLASIITLMEVTPCQQTDLRDIPRLRGLRLRRGHLPRPQLSHLAGIAMLEHTLSPHLRGAVALPMAEPR